MKFKNTGNLKLNFGGSGLELDISTYCLLYISRSNWGGFLDENV